MASKKYKDTGQLDLENICITEKRDMAEGFVKGTVIFNTL